MESTKLCIKTTVIFLLVFTGQAFAGQLEVAKRSQKNFGSFGLQTGMGVTEDIPPRSGGRPNLSFLFFFPNYQRNLTGLIGESWYQGALNWHAEAGLASVVNKDGEILLGVSPLMFQYKFMNLKRSWAPNLLVGAGASYTDWNDVAPNELGGDFQFLLHAGAGIEFFTRSGAFSLNYRFFHISNAGTQNPNVGLNAHVFTLGYQF
jgi:Lipid A 3-O-deacylase (PagL)